jgi:integrase
MSRPNLGPKLALLRKRGWGRALYLIRWTDERGRSREKSTGTDDPGRAQAAFADWLAAYRRARRTGPGDPAQVRVADVLTDYYAEHGPNVASRASLAYAVEPLLAFFADDTLTTLTTKRVREYWPWRRKYSIETLRDRDSGKVLGKRIVERGAKSDGTIIRELGGVLRPAIDHAIKERRLVAGEYHVPVPDAPPPRDYWISRKDAARLIRELRRDRRSRLHLPLYGLIALYAGQRRGAILDLTWTQVDLVAGRIDFNPPGRRRTKKRRPVVPLTPSLLAALRRAQDRATTPFVIEYRGERIGDVKTGFNSAAERAGIPDCTSHTLRHSAATWMAMRGVELREIAKFLGNSEAMVERVYAKHHPDYLKRAVTAMWSKS